MGKTTLFRIFAQHLREEKMKNHKIFILTIVSLTIISGAIVTSCNKDNGDRLPLPPIDITINPNSTIYQELNISGGWLYLDETDGAESPSRGIIVYRAEDQFYAYERTPPFKPDSCCNASKTICSRLIVDDYFPFVMDTCTNSKYLIFDGSPVSGPSSMSLSMYVTEYYGGLLYIHN
jgi:nitrite reductase/ring-hydroxylating ferredoxin subunit